MSIQALTTLTGLECLFLDRTQLGTNLQHFTAFSRLAHLALTTHGSQVGSHGSQWPSLDRGWA